LLHSLATVQQQSAATAPYNIDIKGSVLTSSYSQSTILRISADALLSNVVDILEKSWHPRRLAERDRSVSARIPRSWRSWGENLNVNIIHEDAQSVAVIIKSTSAVKTTIIDWGKNRSNVEKLLAQIHQRLEGQ
jgi:hypothetical protein